MSSSQLPEGWRIEPLNKLLKIQNGYAFNSKQFSSDEGIPLIRIRDLKNGVNTQLNYTGEYDSKFIVKKNDLLIGMDGEFRCYKWHGSDALLNQRVCRLQDFADELIPQFLFYGINKYLKEIEDATTFTTVKHLSAKRIKSILFPLPPLPEQKRIVAILDKAFEGINQAIANAEKNLANAREIFESYLNDVFTRKGEGWEEKRLTEILKIQPRNGWSPPAKNHSDTGTPVLTLSSVTGFNFDLSKIKYTSATTDEKAHYWAENGALLISRSNTPELVGHVAICSGIKEPTIYPDLIMKMMLNSDIALTKFVYYQLRSARLRTLIMASATGANPTMKKINQKIVKGLPVVIPPIEEQFSIVKKFDIIYYKTQHLQSIYQQKLNALQELKQSILQKAFSGNLDTSAIQ